MNCFLLCPAVDRETKFAFGDFISTTIHLANNGEINDRVT